MRLPEFHQHVQCLPRVHQPSADGQGAISSGFQAPFSLVVAAQGDGGGRADSRGGADHGEGSLAGARAEDHQLSERCFGAGG